MFLKLSDAQAVDPTVTQDAIDALEQTVRGMTNNHFHVEATKRHFVGKQGLAFKGDDIVLPNINGKPTVGSADMLRYLHIGDTLEVYGTGLNDGVYEVKEISSATIKVRLPQYVSEFIEGDMQGSLVKVFYPTDIASGMLRLISYDKTMSDKIGVKQETVSRLSVTYFDQLGTDTTEGYPTAYMNFLIKYRKIKWG